MYGFIFVIMIIFYYEVRDILKENVVVIQLNYYKFEGVKGLKQCINNSIYSVLKVFIMVLFNKYFLYWLLYCKCFESLNNVF